MDAYVQIGPYEYIFTNVEIYNGALNYKGWTLVNNPNEYPEDNDNRYHDHTNMVSISQITHYEIIS